MLTVGRVARISQRQMGAISRRSVVGVAATGVAAGLVGRLVWPLARAAELSRGHEAIALSELVTPADTQMIGRFVNWLRTDGVSHERATQNLVFNFWDVNQKAGSWIYPMLSGKAMLWFVRRGSVDEARAIASSLLRWQQTDDTGAHKKSYGAFSSMLEAKDGAYRQGQRFYSGDNLVILEGLLALHAKTKDAALLNAAIGIGTWLSETMCQGKKHGVWADDHGAPMHFVTADGNFSNEIHSSVEMLWIGALDHLGKVTGEAAYRRQALKASEFLRKCQAASGAYLDNYDPGYPPKPYDAGRWRPYQPGQVIGDNMLRSALGACRMGDVGGARKFFQYLKAENGAIPAFLDVSSGGSGFPVGSPVYYDVTSSALHRSLCQWLGERVAAEQDMAFLRAAQHPSGGWPWGLTKDGLKPVEPKLAPVVGFWATADLSANAG